MIVLFCLSLIFWVKYCHIRHFIAIDKLCLLVNIMFIIVFVLTYACNDKKREKMKIKLYFTFK